MAVRFIEKDEIDYSLWDKCISNSLNGELFGYSWYLDMIVDDWGALIEGDYSAVMPLAYSKRLLYREIISHPLLKHTGIYSQQPVTEEKIELFLQALPRKFRKIYICFSRQNTQAIRKNDEMRSLQVYELDLITPYEKLSRSYSKEVRSMLHRAQANKYSVLRNPSFADLISFIETGKSAASKALIVKPLKKILSRMLSKNKAEILAVYGPENSLCSIACFVRSNTNVSLLFAHILPEARDRGAGCLLLDTFLKSYTGRNVTLSLEHIDENWDEMLYRSFNALRSYKYCLVRNNLPLPLKWFL